MADWLVGLPPRCKKRREKPGFWVCRMRVYPGRYCYVGIATAEYLRRGWRKKAPRFGSRVSEFRARVGLGGMV